MHYYHDSPMRSRSIDNYLSPHDIELISNFIQQSVERFEKYDGRIRTSPQRFNTAELQKLYIEKYNLWDKAVKNPLPNSSSTYLDQIRNSDDKSACPIEQFLKTLMQVIEQAINPIRYQGFLQKLEKELITCEHLCPCPSEP
jgi:hypothetical protein